MKRKPIAQVSQKRKKENQEYLKLNREFLLAHPRCQAGLNGICTSLSTEVHHKAKRGKFLCRVDLFLATCRGCHQWIEEHRHDAEVLGLTLTIEQIRKLNEP